MIRIATERDIPRLVELGQMSLQNGPYKDRVKDVPEQSVRLAQMLIQTGKVLLIECEDGIVGVLGLAFFPHYYTGEKTAAEVIWYILPEYRPHLGLESIALFRAAERVAREEGCTMIQFTAPTQQVAKIYETAGLKALEVAYYKDLN